MLLNQHNGDDGPQNSVNQVFQIKSRKGLTMWYCCPGIFLFVLRAKIYKGIMFDLCCLWPCAKRFCIQKDTLNKIIYNLTQNILAPLYVSILSLRSKVHSFFFVCHLEVFNTYIKYTMMYQSNTTKLYYVYYCIRATCFDSYRIIFRPF